MDEEKILDVIIVLFLFPWCTISTKVRKLLIATAHFVQYFHLSLEFAQKDRQNSWKSCIFASFVN